MLWTCISLKGGLPCASREADKISRIPLSKWASYHIKVNDPRFIAVLQVIVLTTFASFLILGDMLWRILAWLCFAALLLIVHTVPASLIFIGISPYTGMTFDCFRPHCKQVPESSSTIVSTIAGALIATIIWISVLYGFSEGIVSGRERYLRRRPQRYITPAF